MQIKVISLKSRQDRRALFAANNKDSIPQYDFVEAFDGRNYTYAQLRSMGYDVDHNWRDPILKRVLTQGEVGCFISHWRLWAECALGTEPFLIVEDDAVLDEHVDFVTQRIPDDVDMCYLACREMKPEGVVKLSEGFVKPCYPYHTTCYWITPEAAKELIKPAPQKCIIPVDEYLPRMLDRVNCVAFEKHPARQLSRSEIGTDVEPTNEAHYIRDFTTHVLTVGSDETKMKRLYESAAYNDVKVTNLFHHELDKWNGSDMVGPGGGQKINLIMRYIEDKPDHDVVLFTDGYDVMYVRGVEDIVGRFLGFKSEIVFSSEWQLWPNKSLTFPPVHTKYRYLNSGTFIGRVGELKRFLRYIPDSSDDQEYMQREYLTGRYDIELDVEGYIFQTHEDAIIPRNDKVMNPLTGCWPCIYHANGGPYAKAKFDQLYTACFPELKYIMTKDFRVLGPEMLLIDFMTETQCQEWIDISEEHGGWNPHPDDKFPSHDIHLKEIGLWDDVEHHWAKVVAPICEGYWSPYLHYHMRKAFTMKYSDDTQKTLGKHTDASLVTGSVKLNDDYDGATLVFPRQDVTNKDIPIGKMILFPGQVTHGHYVTELQSGTKYSATFWTARFKGDYLNPED